MGDMALSEMRTATKWALDNRSNIDDTQLNRWINWTYRHISQPRVHRHQPLQGNLGIFLLLDTVSYSTFSLPMWGIYGIWYVEGGTINDPSIRRHRLRGGYDIRATDESVVSQGRPTRYSMWGGDPGPVGDNLGMGVINLDRRPGPAQVGHFLHVRGYRVPPLLTVNTQQTLLFPTWDEVLVLGATWRGFRELGENARAEVARQNFGLMVEEQQESRKLDAEDWGGAFEVDLQPYVSWA